MKQKKRKMKMNRIEDYYEEQNALANVEAEHANPEEILSKFEEIEEHCDFEEFITAGQMSLSFE